MSQGASLGPPRTWFIPPHLERLLAARPNSHRAASELSARAVATYIKVEPEAGIISYTGQGLEDAEAATIRTTESIPADCPLYYFEVEVLNQGESGRLGVGLMEAHVHLHRLPGWEPCSYGYHGDDGNVFHGEGHGRPYGQRYGTGDCVGVSLDCVQRRLTFYKNGMCCGVAFRDVTTAPLHPCVGMRSRDARVQVNLGSRPFRHGVAVELLRAELAAHVSKQILQTPLPPAASAASTSPAALAVLDHLIHTCCWKTARVVARDLLGLAGGAAALLSDADVQLMCMRQKIRQLLEAGQAMEAKSLLEQVCPGLLATRPDVDFTLQLQMFVELLRFADRSPVAQNAALQFARTTLPKLKVDAAQRERLRDALALLAYEDPTQSPSAFLFHQDRRSACAAEVNGAIMRHQGRQPVSAVESLYLQLAVVSRELAAMGSMTPQLVSFQDVLHRGLHRRTLPEASGSPDHGDMQE